MDMKWGNQQQTGSSKAEGNAWWPTEPVLVSHYLQASDSCDGTALQEKLAPFNRKLEAESTLTKELKKLRKDFGGVGIAVGQMLPDTNKGSQQTSGYMPALR